MTSFFWPVGHTLIFANPHTKGCDHRKDREAFQKLISQARGEMVRSLVLGKLEGRAVCQKIPEHIDRVAGDRKGVTKDGGGGVGDN